MTRSKSFAIGIFVGFVMGIAGTVALFAVEKRGGRKEACYPNSTCDSGLTCIDDICVKKDSTDDSK